MVLKLIFFLFYYLSYFLVFGTAAPNSEKDHHEQVHLSLGADHTEMIVTWTTLRSIAGEVMVRYGEKGKNLSFHAIAENTEFHDKESHFFTFRAILVNLKPNTVYEYQVGSTQSTWSPKHHFHTLKPNHELLPKFAIVGDLGLENGVSIPHLKTDTEKGMYDVLFHIGDIAYNLHERKGHQGHDFMNKIEPISSIIPYMTCPGNHESFGNFSHYDARFSMLGNFNKTEHLVPLKDRLNNHYYSFNLGPAHIIMFSSEFYFYPKYYGIHHFQKQFAWLENDLKIANHNRKDYPWIIAMAHRPLYCFNCENLEHKELRLGPSIDGVHNSGLENLFFKYGVDLQFYGHQHHYARTLPVHNKILKNHSGEGNHFHDSQGPIHYITGSGGCREKHTKFNQNLSHVKFLGFYREDYGYTRMTFLDPFKIKLEQTSIDHEGKVIDTIQVSKSHPEPAWMRK